MNFLTAIQVLPNKPFPLLAMTNEDSATLSIGADCLDLCAGNVNKAFDKFPAHACEIILSHLYLLFSSQLEPDAEIFGSVIKLIAKNDENY